MGNSLLFGLPEYQINRLQKIQIHRVRLITKTPVNMHITPVVKHLHWLPIRQRIEYKLLHVYRALSGQGPSYMSDLVQQYIPARSLRSAAEPTASGSKDPLHIWGQSLL